MIKRGFLIFLNSFGNLLLDPGKKGLLAHLSLCLPRQLESVPAESVLPPDIGMSKERKMLCDPIWKGVFSTW